MTKSYLAYTGLLLSLVAAPVFAQTATPSNAALSADTSTNVSQQQQIEQGLQSGQLTTKEAAKLENGEKRIDNTEAAAAKNGTVSPQEQARINAMQTNEQNQITKLDNNSATGNPNSASSQRMQADVQRNVDQQTRIQNGVNNGSLTTRETGRMERGQAKVSRAEAKAGANGHVSAQEQANIQGRENHQSGHIYRAKHNAAGANAGATPAAAPAPAAGASAGATAQ